MKTLQAALMIVFTGLLAGCSSTPLSNPAALSQLSSLTTTKSEGKLASTVGMSHSLSFDQIKATAQKVKKVLDPNSPEALHREEMIARGEIEEEDAAQAEITETNAFHLANIDNCPAPSKMTGVTFSAIPMGISECEMVSLRGKPSEIRRLSMPNEPRRILLSFNSKNGPLLYEFVDNRLTTIY